MIDGLNLETLAVILGIAYIVLAMRENSLCWYCAFFSTALYVWIFGDVSLYMESALNVYYMGMAVYGWFLWRRGGEQKAGVTIVRWPVSRHLQIVCIILLLSLGSGYLLSEHTNAIDPLSTHSPPGPVYWRPLWWLKKCWKIGYIGFSSIPSRFFCS